jgi:hypothetical protein
MTSCNSTSGSRIGFLREFISDLCHRAGRASDTRTPLLEMMRRLRRQVPLLALAFSAILLPSAIIGQSIHIANVSMSPSGALPRPYSAFSAVASHFDLVAADDVGDAGGLEKVLSGMDEGWEAIVGRGGYFGFLYSDQVQMVKELGTYRGKSDFAQPPYGAQFRLAGTRFALNLVLCRVAAKKGVTGRAAEIAGLASVYRYFENLTGNRGITILLAPGLGDDRERAARLLTARGDVMALKAGGHIFASAALRPRIEETGIGASTPPAVFVILRTGR